MRFALALAVIAKLSKCASGFAFVVGTPQHQRHLVSALYSTSTTNGDGDSGQKKDEYDDWYSDFNPADFAWADTSSGDRPSSRREGGPSSTRRPPRATTSRGDGAGSSSRGGYSRGDGAGSSSRGGYSRGDGTGSYSRSDGHDYSRDPSDNSNVNEVVVNQLIQDRLTARKTGQFEQADVLRDVLLNDHGVTVWDRDRVWRSGCSSSGSGMKGGGRQQRDGGRGEGRGRGGRGESRGGPARGAGGRRTNFGPNGHDYDLSNEAGPNNSNLSDGDIHRLIAERLKYKMSRDFTAADEIQDELIANGVFVHDGRKEWRADGQGFGEGGGGKPGREAGSRSDRNKPYEQSKYSFDTDDVNVIQDLVAERIEAKRARDFDTADAIRDELLEDYDVVVDDRNRQWSVGGDFGETMKRDSDRDRPYDMSPQSLQVNDEELRIIQDLVAQRANAKKTREFSTADSIRDELKYDYNVEIDDRQRLWSVGGDFGFDESDRREPGPYAMAPGSELPAEAEYIQRQVEAREQARNDREFALADEIRDELMDQYNVMVDDKVRQWAVGGMFGTRKSAGPGDPFVRRGGGDLTKEQEETIHSMIRARNDAKRDKDFGKADRIRDKLRDEFAVSVDDRSREWFVVSDDYVMSPVTPMDEELKLIILKKINERSIAKLNKDYDVADDIRDELYNEYNIYLDDRVREWRVEGQVPSRLSGDEEVSSYNEQWTPDDEDDDAVEDLDTAMDKIFESAEVIDETSTSGKVAVEMSTRNFASDLESLTVIELKERLRLAGLPVSGKKSELIQRLSALD